MKNILSILSFTCAVLAVAASADDLRLSRYYSDHMVLQRDKPNTIRGSAVPGSEVTVLFSGQEKTGRANEQGLWEVTLDPMPANASGQTLAVRLVSGKPGKDGSPRGGARSDRPLLLSDIVVGDVFLFARQTSIDVSLGRDTAGTKAAVRAGDAGFRVLQIKTIPAADPLQDLPADACSEWMSAAKANALKMSGAAFYMAAGIAEGSKVPVGVVDLNMGDYFPIAWMSREDLLATGSVMPAKTGKKLYQGNNAVESQVKARTLDLHKFRSGEPRKAIDEFFAQAVEKAGKNGAPPPTRPVPAPDPLRDPRFPAAGYNSVIHPLRGLALKAVVLQLGNDYPYVLYQKIARDGNATSRGHLGWAWKNNYDIRKWCIYLEPWTMPRIVPRWRMYFDDKDLPFGLVLPPGSDLGTLADHHCAMRELQRKVAVANSGVGLILPGTEHVPFSAQPADEKLLGQRALSWVRGAVFGLADGAASGPVFDHLESAYSKATVFFKKGTAAGLTAAPGALDHFEVAGADGIYQPAKAAIDGTVIQLSSDKVNRIVHVRYNWIHKPDQGLRNDTGLPAVPFRTDDEKYPDVFWHAENDLPEEYSTPAKDWTSGDIAIINGSLAPGNWDDAEGWLGACGVLVAPFGPNMAVLNVLKGSPADGRILVGDLIYDVNGELFGEHPLKDVAAALAHAESEAGEGKISFGLRRKGKNTRVNLVLEVLGTYSSTSPYNCPKSDKIVSNMEAFLAERGGVMPGKHNVFQNTDALFMQAAGTPKYLGLVRRHVYQRMSLVDLDKRLDPYNGPFIQNWVPAYDALLAGEYYLATGDRNVLPFLKWTCDYLAMTQNKVEAAATPWPTALAGQAGGWRHNFYGRQGYGMLPNVGLPALLGFRFAIEAGVDVDRSAYQRGINYFIHNGARVGSVFYGHVPEPVTVPEPINNEALINGKLSSFNGAKALAAILFKYEGDLRTAHLLSFVCAHSYNNTHHAHGGNFWGNTWTGLGAYAHSKDAFIQFMRGNAWYRDLHRMYNHSHYQGGRGGIGGGEYLALVLPRHRLRILGAPESVFSANPPGFLRPALDAHRHRDYARCIEQVDALMAARALSVEDKTKAEQLRRVCAELLESIDIDLKKVKGLIDEGKLYEASLDLPQLEGVVAPGNERLAGIRRTLEDPGETASIARDAARYKQMLKGLEFDISMPKPAEDKEGMWTCLTPQNGSVRCAFRGGLGSASAEDASIWRMNVLESVETAPDGWSDAGFDGGSWTETSLPISWPLNHTVLLRTKFDIRNRKTIEALRIRLNAYRQQNMRVFINGQLVAKVNNASNNNELTAMLTEQAVKSLKNGSNTLAVTTRNNWRWGSYMAGVETEEANSVRNNGFTLLLDARGK